MVDGHLRASHIMFDLLAAHHINTLLYLIILYRRRQHFLQQRVQQQVQPRRQPLALLLQVHLTATRLCSKLL